MFKQRWFIFLWANKTHDLRVWQFVCVGCLSALVSCRNFKAALTSALSLLLTVWSHEDHRVWLLVFGRGGRGGAADSPPRLLVSASGFSAQVIKKCCSSVCSEMKNKTACVQILSDLTPRLPLSIVECSQFLGICALPGKGICLLYNMCKFVHVYVVILLKDFLKLDVKMPILSADRLQIQRRPQESGKRYP